MSEIFVGASSNMLRLATSFSKNHGELAGNLPHRAQYFHHPCHFVPPFPCR